MSEEKSEEKKGLELYNEEKAADRVYLNTSQLEVELAKNPSWMLFYSTRGADWMKEADISKIEAKNRRGQVEDELKKSGAKVTGASLEAAQDRDPKYLALMHRHYEAKSEANKYYGALTALDKKQFSMQQLLKSNKTEENATKSISYISDNEETFAEKMQRVMDAQR